MSSSYNPLLCPAEFVDLCWPGSRSREQSISKSEIQVSGELLKYISTTMSFAFNQQQFDEWFSFQDLPDRDYIPLRQLNATKGAMMSHFFMSCFERATSTLLSWDIISQYSHDLFEMKLDAVDIPDMIRQSRDLNREKFSWSIESFFNLDYQMGLAGIPRSLVDYFISAGLVVESCNSLSWTEKMEPHFMFMIGGAPEKYKEGRKGRKNHEREEAAAFFNRICGDGSAGD